MIDEFPKFAALVQQQYDAMSKHELFQADVLDIFGSYLAAFPEGTNPIFRERTEHDCNCCKQFIRKIGALITVSNDGRIQTVWDRWAEMPEPYQTVSRALMELVLQAPISDVFRTKERRFGQAYTYDTKMQGHRWSHLTGEVNPKHHSLKPDEARGRIRTVAQVFERGLKELSLSALDTVLDLIESNSLYRGAEHKNAVVEFRALRKTYEDTSHKELFAWSKIHAPVARFRNTVIGSLVVDLSSGVDLERAVRSFESKVAPTNYKRPTSLITSGMIDKAVATLKALGLENSIQRRMANVRDVSVNNVLFVDNAVRGQMKDGIAGLLAGSVKPKPVDLKHATPISIADFLAMPKDSIDVLVENKHLSHFMTLTTGAGRLFKWDNDFAWSYDGEVTDSIKERVKAAGGNVNAKLRCSLAWHNLDDLDIHCFTPNGGHIYYGNKSGVLDVDMNAGSGTTRDPVENLSWTGALRDGDYKVQINQYRKRENENFGFTIEVESDGEIQQFSYTKAVVGDVPAVVLTVKGGKLVKVQPGPGLTGGTASIDKWGVKTETLVRVDTLMASPNHWDGQEIGNKHWFFFLKGCKNPDPVRGIYNEFLGSSLEEHRKVFEVLGSKTKCAPTDDQLSGVGFSSTNGDSVTVVVNQGRAYRVQF